MSIGGKLRFARDMILKRESPVLKVGDVAPPFETRDHRGEPLSLSDLRGKKVVLWFFPKADTPG